MTADLASLNTSLSSILDRYSARFAMKLGSCYTREQHKMTGAIGCPAELTFYDLAINMDEPKTYQKEIQNTSVVGLKNGEFHVHRRSGHEVSKLRLKKNDVVRLRRT